MKRLDLILNGKGGVGKSFFAVNFVQYLKDKGITHVAIDSDNENSTLKRFHPDARFVDLDDRRGPDGHPQHCVADFDFIPVQRPPRNCVAATPACKGAIRQQRQIVLELRSNISCPASPSFSLGEGV